jgi:hypothetical protein
MKITWTVWGVHIDCARRGKLGQYVIHRVVEMQIKPLDWECANDVINCIIIVTIYP